MKRGILYWSSGMVLCWLLWVGCKQPTHTPAIQQPAVTPNVSLKSLPVDSVQNWWTNCTNMDYMFLSPSMSVNVNEPNSIKMHLRFISDEVPTTLDCPLSGRLYYTVGRSLLEAEIHYQAGRCAYFVFLDATKRPMYANKITQEGITKFLHQMAGARVVARDSTGAERDVTN